MYVYISEPDEHAFDSHRVERLVDARNVFQPIPIAENINKGTRTGYYSNNIQRERKML